jgi:DNA-binding transcriptional LysR family regulator
MELREIVSFYHVSRLQSVSKAARRLELGQPTVTTHLKKLEDEFSITLFDRIKRPIQLTSDGRTFLQLITPIVECVDSLKTNMDYSERRGSFVVGAYPDLIMHHLPNPIKSFWRDYPDVRLKLVSRSYASLIQLVKSGEVDLALCTAPPVDDASLEFRRLFDYNIVMMTPPGHALLSKPSILLEDAAEWPLILAGPESLVRRRVESALKEQQVHYEVVLEMDNTELIKQYVEIGMGIAIGSDFTLHPDDHDKLGVIRMDHIFTGSEIGICTLKGKFIGRAIRNFMDNLIENLDGFHPDVSEWNLNPRAV